MLFRRLKNRALARVLTRFPALSRFFIPSGGDGRAEGDIPWAGEVKPLCDAVVAVVTTAGVHMKGQTPFDMHDPSGDPTFREIDITRPLSDLMITHDYYDHRDADRDVNIVFPVDRLREFQDEGLVGRVSDVHYGFMGHIEGRHVDTLVRETAPEAARRLREQGVDVVLLTPG